VFDARFDDASTTFACILSGTGVTANCLHPGAAYTEMWRQKVPNVPACFQRLVTFAMRFVVVTSPGNMIYRLLLCFNVR